MVETAHRLGRIGRPISGRSCALELRLRTPSVPAEKAKKDKDSEQVDARRVLDEIRGRLEERVATRARFSRLSLVLGSHAACGNCSKGSPGSDVAIEPSSSAPTPPAPTRPGTTRHGRPDPDDSEQFTAVGDITAARLVLQRAAEACDPRAALILSGRLVRLCSPSVDHIVHQVSDLGAVCSTDAWGRRLDRIERASPAAFSPVRRSR